VNDQPFSTLVTANSPLSVAISADSGSRAQVTVSNLLASAGNFTAGLSENGAARNRVTMASGRIAVSPVYRFSYTPTVAGGALTSATLSYSVRSSDTPVSDIQRLAWYKFDEANQVWVKQGSTVTGSSQSDAQVTYTTTSFSEWSVQEDISAAQAAAHVSVALVAMLTAAITKRGTPSTAQLSQGRICAHQLYCGDCEVAYKEVDSGSASTACHDLRFRTLRFTMRMMQLADPSCLALMIDSS
jgi:hypothetical protein